MKMIWIFSYRYNPNHGWQVIYLFR
ncbi:uncharacterized protein METZ01_LOCUS282085, partial [marine metagenome]